MEDPFETMERSTTCGGAGLREKRKAVCRSGRMNEFCGPRHSDRMVSPQCRIHSASPAPRQTSNPAQRHRHGIAPGIQVDVRRAVWLPGHRTLAVSDLHLGYVWAHRHSGQMLPLSVPRKLCPRLAALVEHTRHRTRPARRYRASGGPRSSLGEELCRLSEEIGSRTTLHWVAGNHDKRLANFCRPTAPVELLTEYQRDRICSCMEMRLEESAATHLASVRSTAGRVIIGHEHPAFSSRTEWHRA